VTHYDRDEQSWQGYGEGVRTGQKLRQRTQSGRPSEMHLDLRFQPDRYYLKELTL